MGIMTLGHAADSWWVGAGLVAGVAMPTFRSISTACSSRFGLPHALVPGRPRRSGPRRGSTGWRRVRLLEDHGDPVAA
jgi:hypothetical protein